jgi:DNA repair protein RecN (Recombination protein N)
MLLELSVQNLVLIERLSIELGPGFHVLTGETGAGKSMLVDALGLVLGGRASPDLVRKGEKEAEVEARFELPEGSSVRAKLEAAGIPCDGELVVRRVVAAEGRSRAFMNGRLSTAAQLAEIGRELCDISSQHESVSLTDPSSHLDYLDAFGSLAELRRSLAAGFAELAAVVRSIETTRAAERSRSEREDFLAFQAPRDRRSGPGAGRRAHPRVGARAAPARREALPRHPERRRSALRRREHHLRRPRADRLGPRAGRHARPEPFARRPRRRGGVGRAVGRGPANLSLRRVRRGEP